MKKKTTKPVVTGPVDGNIFCVMNACTKALKNAGMKKQADELVKKIIDCESYDKALGVCMQYVHFDI